MEKESVPGSRSLRTDKGRHWSRSTSGLGHWAGDLPGLEDPYSALRGVVPVATTWRGRLRAAVGRERGVKGLESRLSSQLTWDVEVRTAWQRGLVNSFAETHYLAAGSVASVRGASLEIWWCRLVPRPETRALTYEGSDSDWRSRCNRRGSSARWTGHGKLGCGFRLVAVAFKVAPASSKGWLWLEVACSCEPLCVISANTRTLRGDGQGKFPVLALGGSAYHLNELHLNAP